MMGVPIIPDYVPDGVQPRRYSVGDASAHGQPPPPPPPPGRPLERRRTLPVGQLGAGSPYAASPPVSIPRGGSGSASGMAPHSLPSQPYRGGREVAFGGGAAAAAAAAGEVVSHSVTPDSSPGASWNPSPRAALPPQQQHPHSLPKRWAGAAAAAAVAFPPPQLHPAQSPVVQPPADYGHPREDAHTHSPRAPPPPPPMDRVASAPMYGTPPHPPPLHPPRYDGPDGPSAAGQWAPAAEWGASKAIPVPRGARGSGGGGGAAQGLAFGRSPPPFASSFTPSSVGVGMSFGASKVTPPVSVEPPLRVMEVAAAAHSPPSWADQGAHGGASVAGFGGSGGGGGGGAGGGVSAVVGASAVGDNAFLAQPALLESAPGSSNSASSSNELLRAQQQQQQQHQSQLAALTGDAHELEFAPLLEEGAEEDAEAALGSFIKSLEAAPALALFQQPPDVRTLLRRMAELGQIAQELRPRAPLSAADAALND